MSKIYTGKYQWLGSFSIKPDVCATLTGGLERSFEDDEKDKDGSSNGKSKSKSEEEEPVPDCTLVAEIQVCASHRQSNAC